MTKKMCASFVTRLVCIACLTLVGAIGCAPPPSVNVTGGWSGTMTYTSGPMASLTSAFSMELFDDEGHVAGSATFPSGGTNTFEIPITVGEVHADTVLLEAAGQNPFTTPQTPVRFAFDGEATATTMSGVGTHTVNNTAYNFTWRATLVAPPAPEES